MECILLNNENCHTVLTIDEDEECLIVQLDDDPNVYDHDYTKKTKKRQRISNNDDDDLIIIDDEIATATHSGHVCSTSSPLSSIMRYQSPSASTFIMNTPMVEEEIDVKNVINVIESDPEDDDLLEVNESYMEVVSVDDDCSFNEDLNNTDENLRPIDNNSSIMQEELATFLKRIRTLEEEIDEDESLLRRSNTNILRNKGARLREIMDDKKLELKRLQDEYNAKVAKHQIPNSFYRPSVLTMDKIEHLHGVLNSRPKETERAQDPQGLNVKLMPHQQHALAWALWREKQKPSGGILADDMGLGKTLTMISLILAQSKKQVTIHSSDDDNDIDDEWIIRFTNPIRQDQSGNTLIVCPASLLAQWEAEILNKCKRKLLSVKIFHGNSREKDYRRLLNYDVILTTYHLLARSTCRTMLFKIHWKRIILDEAHIIRNHTSNFCRSVCELVGDSKWSLTGTPIHNHENDLYPILKFLKFAPFDDLKVWRELIDRRRSNNHERLATLMKPLMLRRTKEELMNNGSIPPLPPKALKIIDVELDEKEREIYENLLACSQTLFAQFLQQRAERESQQFGTSLHGGQFHSTPRSSRVPEITTQQLQFLGNNAVDVHKHKMLWIFVLILRLRQICCHASLIDAILAKDDMKHVGVDSENINMDTCAKIDREIIKTEQNKLLHTSNPVFERKRHSSKMRSILKYTTEILDKNDKMIIVSQWTSYLNIIAENLDFMAGATYEHFNGTVPVKDRQAIIDRFNDIGTDPKILLLSLTAGGVGLNLVGGNHILFTDIHWNPQLESQAEDRLYRFGQKKNVYVYKFICINTIEERIRTLQENKLSIASAILTPGADRAHSSRLTLAEIKKLFGNLFVIAAILLERNLQSVANYLILSLAVADLLVALLVMPLGAVYEVSHQWTLGPELCDVWTSADVLCCTASILHLVAIALDRYWAVTNIDYIHHRTAKRIGVMIVVVWMVAFLVCIAPLCGWKDPQWEERVVADKKCLVSQDVGYQIFATVSSFYLPFLVILILYWRIFQTARKRIRRRVGQPINAQGATKTMGGSSKTMEQGHAVGDALAQAQLSGGIAAAVVTVIGRPLPTISETTTAFTTVSSTNTSPEKTSYHNGLEPDPPTMDTPPSKPTLARRKKIATESKREKKARKTLLIITGAFVLCWLPFFVIAILLPVCQTCDINVYLIAFFQWLGYFNSTLNPVIYTIFSPEFRSAFKNLLCRKRRRVGRRMGVRHYM